MMTFLTMIAKDEGKEGDTKVSTGTETASLKETVSPNWDDDDVYYYNC